VGLDFVGEFVAGAIEGAPHVPGSDSAVGMPALPEGEKFLRARHVFFTVGDGPAFFDPEVVDGKNIRAAEAENQKHFNGPGADAADRDEALDEFVVGEFFSLLEGGDDAVESFLGEVLHGENFCAGEAGFAERGLAELQHFLRSGSAAGGAEGFDAGVDGGGGFAGDGLIRDGFEERFVRRLELVGVGLEGHGVGDEFGEFFVAGGEIGHGLLEVEGRSAGGFGGVVKQACSNWKRGNRLTISLTRKIKNLKFYKYLATKL